MGNCLLIGEFFCCTSYTDGKDYHMKFGSYYQAQVDPAHAWFFVGALRSFEHMAFDRTFDVASSRFEFLVPEDTEKYFLEFMRYFQQQKIIFNLTKMDNRLANPDAQV